MTNAPYEMPSTAVLGETLMLLNQVVHAAVTSIVVTDPNLPDGPIIYHNPAFELLTGYGASEIDGRNCRFLQGLDTDPNAVSLIRDSIKAGQPSKITLLNYRKDGSTFWNELAISPVRDREGRLMHFVGVQHDVTFRKELEIERDRLLEQQSNIVATLQKALFLTPPTAFKGLNVDTQYESAGDEAQIGGDFYDAASLDDRRVALVCGDVTGKGLKAAQYTAEVKFGLRILLRDTPDAPELALTRLNHFLVKAQLLDGRDENALVCLSVAVIDTLTGNVRAAAGGMEPLLLIRADTRAETVSTSGPILGVDPDARYEPASFTLLDGDTMILCTDGITESRNEKREFFGYEGLVDAAREAVLTELPTLTDMGRWIMEASKSFGGGKRPDDACVVLARRS